MVYNITWLNSQHQKFISQMKSELQAFLSGPVVQNSIDKGHDGSLHVDLVPVDASGTVQVVDDALKSGPLEGVLLVVQH